MYTHIPGPSNFFSPVSISRERERERERAHPSEGLANREGGRSVVDTHVLLSSPYITGKPSFLHRLFYHIYSAIKKDRGVGKVKGKVEGLHICFRKGKPPCKVFHKPKVTRESIKRWIIISHRDNRGSPCLEKLTEACPITDDHGVN